MPSVIFEDKEVIATGKYLREVRISRFPPDANFPEGVRYSLCLVDCTTNKVILLYDIHRGKSHHRHLRGQETPYTFVDEDSLLTDFLRDVDLIVEGKL